MSKGAIIVVIGILVAFLPFTGFPTGVKTVLAIILGLGVAGVGFLVRQERIWLLRLLKGQHSTNAYSENAPKRSALVE